MSVKRWCATAMLWFLGSVEAIIRNYKTRLGRLSAASGEGLSSAPPTGAQRILALETEEPPRVRIPPSPLIDLDFNQLFRKSLICSPTRSRHSSRACEQRAKWEASIRLWVSSAAVHACAAVSADLAEPAVAGPFESLIS